VRLQNREREGVDVNLTPLIDVVFLLLIFFVLTTTFQKEARMRVELPSAASVDQVQPQEPIEIHVNRQGGIGLSRKPSSQWQEMLRERLAESPERSLVIRADHQAPHGAVVEVMDRAQQLGVSNLSIATDTSLSSN